MEKFEQICPKCGATLRLPDYARGRQARCVSCDEIFTVPGGGAVESPELEPAAAPAAESTWQQPIAEPTPANPYAATSTVDRVAEAPAPGGPFQPRAVTTDPIFPKAWESFDWMFVLAFFLMGMINGGATFIVRMVLEIPAQFLAPQLDDEVLAAVIIGFAVLVSQLAGQLITAYFTVGLIRIRLGVMRGQPVDISQLFSGGDLMLNLFIANIIFFIMVGCGMLLMIVPGIFVALLFWPYAHVLVDRRTGPIESLKIAYEIGNLNKMTSFVIGLAAMGLAFLGVLMCFVGTIVTYPLAMLISTTAYLMMTSQYVRGSQATIPVAYPTQA